MARTAANVTITVPLELKDEMEIFSGQYPGTNWSAIARRAIEQYIQTHRGPVPQIRISLSGSELIIGQFGTALMTRLFFENKMTTEVTIDRRAVSQTVFTGVEKFLASRDTSWNMTPLTLRPNEHIVIPEYFLMDPRNLLEIERLNLVDPKGLTIRTGVQAYVPGFAEPISTEIIDRLPWDYWRDFIDHVKRSYPHLANKTIQTESSP